MADWSNLPKGIKDITGYTVVATGAALNPFEAARQAVGFNLEGLSESAPTPNNGGIKQR